MRICPTLSSAPIRCHAASLRSVTNRRSRLPALSMARNACAGDCLGSGSERAIAMPSRLRKRRLSKS